MNSFQITINENVISFNNKNKLIDSFEASSKVSVVKKFKNSIYAAGKGWIWEWDEKLNLNKNPFVLIENYNYDIIDLTIWSRIELTKIFALTKSKNLLVFQDRIMESWIELKNDEEYYSVDSSSKVVVLAGSNGRIRLFDPINYTILDIFPPPPEPLSTGIELLERYPNALVKYPSCTSIKLIKQQDENKDQWACIYENGLVVIWQTEFHNEKHYQFFKIGEENVHNSSVIDLDSIMDGTFLSLSSDGNVLRQAFTVKRGFKLESSLGKSGNSFEAISIGHIQDSCCLKESKDGKWIVFGLLNGGLKVLNGTNGLKDSIQYNGKPHSSSIQSIDIFSPPLGSAHTKTTHLIVSGSNDSSVRVHEISQHENTNHYEMRDLVELCGHVSGVLNVRFVIGENKSNQPEDIIRIIVTGKDGYLTVWKLDLSSNSQFVPEKRLNLGCSISDVDLDFTNHYLVSISHNYLVQAIDLSLFKVVRDFQLFADNRFNNNKAPNSVCTTRGGSNNLVNCLKGVPRIRFDPSGLYFAVSCPNFPPNPAKSTKKATSSTEPTSLDCSIRLYDFFNGSEMKKWCTPSTFNSSLITKLTWALDWHNPGIVDSCLISSHIDGSIEVFRINIGVVRQEIGERMRIIASSLNPRQIQNQISNQNRKQLPGWVKKNNELVENESGIEGNVNQIAGNNKWIQKLEKDKNKDDSFIKMDLYFEQKWLEERDEVNGIWSPPNIKYGISQDNSLQRRKWREYCFKSGEEVKVDNIEDEDSESSNELLENDRVTNVAQGTNDERMKFLESSISTPVHKSTNMTHGTVKSKLKNIKGKDEGIQSEILSPNEKMKIEQENWISSHSQDSTLPKDNEFASNIDNFVAKSSIDANLMNSVVKTGNFVDGLRRNREIRADLFNKEKKLAMDRLEALGYNIASGLSSESRDTSPCPVPNDSARSIRRTKSREALAMLSQNENKDIMLADKIKRVDELMNSIKSSIDGDTEASLAVKDALDRWNKMFL